MQTVYTELPNYVKEIHVNLHGQKVLLTNIINNELSYTGLMYNDVYSLSFIGTNDNYVNRTWNS